MSGFVEQWGPWVGLVGGAVGLVSGVVGVIVGGLTVEEKLHARGKRQRAERFDKECEAWLAQVTAAAKLRPGATVDVSSDNAEFVRWAESKGRLKVMRHESGIVLVRLP